MKTRVLKIHLAEALKAQLEKYPKTDLAKKIGVSTGKMTAMMNDEWEYITRDAIERAADFLNLTVVDIFHFEPVDFWKQIEQAQRCIFLRGSQEGKSDEREFHIPRYDDEATFDINTFLRSALPDIRELIVADHPEVDAELIERAKRENCIVIGSPKSNAASEILLSRFFGAEPFDASPENRQEIPFGFCWPDDGPVASQSSLTCSEPAREETKFQPGIALKGVHVPADYKEEAEFISWDTEEGRDCGLVFVANKPFGTKKNVKLIVLAGFSGIGTLAAARALIEDFRYLEPIGTDPCVYGVIEAKYTKSAGSYVRTFKEFRWRYRKGGHAPISGRKRSAKRGS
jgi:DNA-binding Xre family transcriptional regulator